MNLKIGLPLPQVSTLPILVAINIAEEQKSSRDFEGSPPFPQLQVTTLLSFMAIGIAEEQI